MGGRAAQLLGLDAAPVTVEETVCGIAKQVHAILPLLPDRIVNIIAD